MKYYHLICVSLGIALLSCNVVSVTKNTENLMSAKIDQSCDFSKLDLSVPTGKNACSPLVTKKQIMQGLTGIFINMPAKISLKDSKEIKVCMLRILTAIDAEKYGGSELIVLQIAATNRVVNGNFINDDREEPLPEVESNLDAAAMNMIEEGYFNFNLNNYLDFDKKPGLYHLYITMGPLSSNVVTFEIIPDK